MKLRISFLALASLALGGTARANAAPDVPVLASTEVTTTDADVHGWIAEDEDNICGIKDLKKVTKPAVVDYDELLEATPQVKELKRRDIDPESTKGKALLKEARTLIAKAAELVRDDKGNCGIWKAIANKDDREIPDVTEDIVERF